MTVEELREALASLPPTANVIFRFADVESYDVTEVLYEFGNAIVNVCDIEDRE